jgi:hypothetical protein
MNQQITETTIVSPIDGTENCRQLTVDGQSVYLCYSTGFTSNDQLIAGSDFQSKFEMTMPGWVSALRFTDAEHRCWYPAVVNIPELGMVFPAQIESESDWQWQVAPIITMSETERAAYPIPGSDNEYYETRLAVEQSVFFDKTQFESACEHLKTFMVKQQA